MHGTFWKRCPLSSWPPPKCDLKSNSREGTQPCPSTENWLKIYWAWSHPIRTRPSFPLSHSLLSGSFHKPLTFLHQRVDRLIITITENGPISSHGTRPCLTQWNYEPCNVGPPKTDGSWWRVLTECGPLEKEMANHFSIPALRTPWTVWKGKKIGHWKMSSPGREVPDMLLEISRDKTPERMKRWSQSKNNT